MVGTADTVLIREVSLIQSVLYREVPLYVHTHTHTHTHTHRDKKHAHLVGAVGSWWATLSGSAGTGSTAS